MKKLVLSIFTFILFSSLNINQINNTTVFVCDSDNATKYHLNSNCRGLNACTDSIIEVTFQDAFDGGKTTLCGWED